MSHIAFRIATAVSTSGKHTLALVHNTYSTSTLPPATFARYTSITTLRKNTPTSCAKSAQKHPSSLPQPTDYQPLTPNFPKTKSAQKSTTTPPLPATNIHKKKRSNRLVTPLSLSCPGLDSNQHTREGAAT